MVWKTIKYYVKDISTPGNPKFAVCDGEGENCTTHMCFSDRFRAEKAARAFEFDDAKRLKRMWRQW